MRRPSARLAILATIGALFAAGAVFGPAASASAGPPHGCTLDITACVEKLVHGGSAAK
jgi:hypothetical protein